MILKQTTTGQLLIKVRYEITNETCVGFDINYHYRMFDSET